MIHVFRYFTQINFFINNLFSRKRGQSKYLLYSNSDHKRTTHIVGGPMSDHANEILFGAPTRDR